MKLVTVDLENCYGIKRLNTTFDFRRTRSIAIYAPNGSMKSSLTQTFQDVQVGADSRDRIFPQRSSSSRITDENGVALGKENVLSIYSYDESYEYSEETSTLLLDAKLKKEYDKLHKEISQSKIQLLKALKQQSGSKRDMESEISSAFMKVPNDFTGALIRIEKELLQMNEHPYSDVDYDCIFDEKVVTFLKTKDFAIAIGVYIEKYNELIEASTYFKKGIFNYNNAAVVSKSLVENGFFKAKHSVALHGESKKEITTGDELEEVIQKERDTITENSDLKKKFKEIEVLLTKNLALRAFHDYLLHNAHLLPNLANLDKFKEDILKSYLKVKFELYSDLLRKVETTEKSKKEIEEKAAIQRTDWEMVIDIFNRRFYVPFKLEIKNRTAMIIGQEKVPNLGFIFEDEDGQARLAKASLLEALSTGEKKALYILNILFDIETRKKSKQPTLFIIDDIADSFDYKNKYAIIEYLKEIGEESHFRQIILTHNFDFFRTIESRFVSYGSCFTAYKTPTGLKLEKAVGIRNIFVKDWKQNFLKDKKKMIASIPFIRNIVEYTKGEQDPDFIKLTSLLHWKTNSASISQHELEEIFNRSFNQTEHSKTGDSLVVDLIQAAATECLSATEGINFEHKIVLSIAIRHAAEQYMINYIDDPDFVTNIESNQTAALFSKVKTTPGIESTTVEVLQRVMLMTPESIHLNSFMYEPILDMSDNHLRKLLTDVRSLPPSRNP